MAFRRLHRIVRQGEGHARLEHKRHCVFMHALGLQIRLRRRLELVVVHTVWAESSLIRARAGQERVGATAVRAVDETHELRRGVAVVVGRAECVVCDVPARAEDEEVGERGPGCLRLSREHAEDGGVNVVHGD